MGNENVLGYKKFLLHLDEKHSIQRELSSKSKLLFLIYVATWMIAHEFQEVCICSMALNYAFYLRR